MKRTMFSFAYLKNNNSIIQNCEHTKLSLPQKNRRPQGMYDAQNLARRGSDVGCHSKGLRLIPVGLRKKYTVRPLMSRASVHASPRVRPTNMFKYEGNC